MRRELKKSFDYSVVEKDTKGKLIWYATEIQKQGKAHVESGLEIGRLLSESREFLDGESFKTWVERECGCSIRSAYRYISAFENFGDCATVAHIELSAMYELAKNDCAKKAALRMAKDGKTVTQQIAKELVTKHSESHRNNGKSVASQPSVDPFDVDPFEEEESARDQEPEEGGEDRSQAEVAPPADSSDPEKDFRTQQSKTVKTVEALMRAFDDLQRLRKHKAHTNAITACKNLLQTAKNWQ